MFSDLEVKNMTYECASRCCGKTFFILIFLFSSTFGNVFSIPVRFRYLASCKRLLFSCLRNSMVQAASFGGSNIDPTAWEDKKCKGESRFPAQVKGGWINIVFS